MCILASAGVVSPVVDADVVEEEDQQPARPQQQHHVAQAAEDLPHMSIMTPRRGSEKHAS